MYFCVQDADGGGARVVRVIEAVSTCCHSDAVYFSFLWTVITDEVGVGYFSTLRDGMLADGCNCTRSYDSV